VRRLVVVGAVAAVLALQEHVDLLERRPLGRFHAPALHHQVVDLARTAARPLQHRPRRLRGGPGDGGAGAGAGGVASATVGDQLVVGERVERPASGQRQYLPESHGERPDITLRRKLALHKSARVQQTGGESAARQGE